MEDRSCIMVVDAASKAVVNKVIARMFGDDASAQNLSVALSASGSAPATHYCNHIWRSALAAADLLALPTGAGTLPVFSDGLAWTDFGTTAAAAVAAVASPHLTAYVSAGGVPTEHLAGVLAGLGLKIVVATGGP